jgi:hypothetical protein
VDLGTPDDASSSILVLSSGETVSFTAAYTDTGASAYW